MVSNPFLFMVGCPRSGTTLLLRMLDAHSKLTIIPELDRFPRWFENRDGVTPDGFVTEDLLAKLENSGFGRFSELPVARQELARLRSSGRPILLADLISWFFDRYGEARGKPLVGNKTPHYALHLPTLHHLWPSAKVIHLVRDGRDVARSTLQWRRAPKLAGRFATWGQDPVSTVALWWEWHVRVAREGAASLDGRYREVRYEALVADSRGECEALCDFLEIPYEESMIRFHENGKRRDASLGAKHGWMPTTPGLRDWRSEMPTEDLARFEAVAGDLLDELGYPRGSGPPDAAALAGAAEVRTSFEGRPRPARWEAPLAADSRAGL